MSPCPIPRRLGSCDRSASATTRFALLAPQTSGGGCIAPRVRSCWRGTSFAITVRCCASIPIPSRAAIIPTMRCGHGASTPDAALAEAFQGDRTIDRVRARPYLTGLVFTRALRLLDLAVDSSGAWVTRAGGTFAISTAPHPVTQRWARALVEAYPDLDGVRYNSRFAGHPCAALFRPAATALPDRPVASLPLTHPALVTRLAGAARRLGYTVI